MNKVEGISFLCISDLVASWFSSFNQVECQSSIGIPTIFCDTRKTVICKTKKQCLFEKREKLYFAKREKLYFVKQGIIVF